MYRQKQKKKNQGQYNTKKKTAERHKKSNEKTALASPVTTATHEKIGF